MKVVLGWNNPIIRYLACFSPFSEKNLCERLKLSIYLKPDYEVLEKRINKMRNEIKKTDSHSPQTPNIRGWLKNRFLEFLGLLKMIRYYPKYSFQSIKTQALILFTNGLIFPVARIILGEEKSCCFRQSFFKIHSSTALTIISLPRPFKSRLVMRCADLGFYSEIYFQDIYSQKLLKSGMNIIDVGAHIGVYTVLAAEKVGKDGKVIAIEPEQKNYKQLVENIKLNNFQNVIPINIALADYNGSGKLYLSSFSDGHSLIFNEDKNLYLNVPIKTIDRLLEELDISKIHLIKIDAEGAEIPILKGAEKTLKTNPNIKLIIATEHYPSEAEEVCQFLNDRGFKAKVYKGSIITTI